MIRATLGLAALSLAGDAAAQPARRTYINPIDIDYRYNFEQINDQASYRTGADPAIVRHKDAYYMFQTLADGYWRSTDLIDWTFIKPSRWPFDSIVAPAAWSDGERIIIQPSMMEPEAILVTDAPEAGKLDFLVRRMPPLPGATNKAPEEMKPGEIPPGPWDPALFKDDDGQWYMYWGSSNVFPLYGIAIEFRAGRLIYQGKPKKMLNMVPEKHGWERFGQDHCACWGPGRPSPSYMEGAWMTKVNGRYYLQYGAPGSEFNAYANEMKAAGEDVTICSFGEAYFDIPLYPFDTLPFPALYHYSDSRGLPGLRQKLAAYYDGQYGVPVDPASEIMVTAGSKIGVHMSFMALLEPGDEVVVPEPAWVSYSEQVRLCHGNPIMVPLDVPVTELGSWVTPRTRAIVICSPQNPTGRVYTRDELRYLSARTTATEVNATFYRLPRESAVANWVEQSVREAVVGQRSGSDRPGVDTPVVLGRNRSCKLGARKPLPQLARNSSESVALNLIPALGVVEVP